MPRLPKKFSRSTDKVWQVLADDDFKVHTPQLGLCKLFSDSQLCYVFGFDFGSFC